MAMAQKRRCYPDNNIDVSSDSSVKITLSTREDLENIPGGSQSSCASTSTFESSLPIRSARPVAPNHNDPNHGVFRYGTSEISRFWSTQSDESLKEEFVCSYPSAYKLADGARLMRQPPASTSGSPPQHGPEMTIESTLGNEQSLPITDEQRNTRVPEETCWRPEYDATTMADFRQHLNVINPEEDEYVAREFDEAGEKKVDHLGFLQGGREYKIRTFTLPGRGQKLFMLATECARQLQYRDLYLLLNKNRSLNKIIATVKEKEELINREILPYSYRSRQIAVVTARSMFRQFGSRVIKDGRRVRDDYWEAKAIKQGFTEQDAASEKRPGAASGPSGQQFAPRSHPIHHAPPWSSSQIEEYALQDYRKQLVLEEQLTKRMLAAKQTNQELTQGSTSSSGAPPYPPPLTESHALQDYQVQIMLLEQQKKKRELMARQEPEQRSAFLPKAAPRLPSPTENHHLADYQIQMTLLEQQKRKRKQSLEQEIEHTSGSPTNAQPHRTRPTDNHACQDYQMQLMLLDQQKKKRAMVVKKEPEEKLIEDFEPQPRSGPDRENTHWQALLGTNPDGPPTDYQMQLMLLEQQNKKRLMQARIQRRETTPADYQTQLRELEKANEKRLMLQKQNKERLTHSKTEQDEVTPAEYQMQLLMLEQQNKKRLMLGKQNKERLTKAHEEQDETTPSDYVMQLMMLEQQNKKRLM